MYMPAQIQLQTVKMVEIEPESDVLLEQDLPVLAALFLVEDHDLDRAVQQPRAVDHAPCRSSP